MTKELSPGNAVPLMGIETEYGIIREDLESSDPVEESMRLLQIYDGPSVKDRWNYARERTHLDMRGFSVGRLAQDEEEDEYCEQDRHRPYTYLEMKSDRVLTNGARYYNDHTHPEYGTPECASVLDLVAHDLAGEAIIRHCAGLRNIELGGDHLQVFKNNTDYSGHSYGTHDNYLIPRALAFDNWVRGLVPFLVTRQLYAGAGKVGFEGKNNAPFTGLQLAQRSDFIETVLSIETMTQRPIVNTRDEPHATSTRFRRLHLILGDANMSAYATALKIGTTRWVLDLIANDPLQDVPVLAGPVADAQLVSRDLSGTVALKLESGKTMTPLDIQEWYLERVEQKGPGAGDETEWQWVTREWRRTLEDHRHRPEKLTDRIDWAIKKNLFEEFIAEENIGWDDPLLKSLDLEYHNLDPERGLYFALQAEGGLQDVVDPKRVDDAKSIPPANTRAALRGQAVAEQPENIKNIHWTAVEFNKGDILDLTDIIFSKDVESFLKSSKEQVA